MRSGVHGGFYFDELLVGIVNHGGGPEIGVDLDPGRLADDDRCDVGMRRIGQNDHGTLLNSCFQGF